MIDEHTRKFLQAADERARRKHGLPVDKERDRTAELEYRIELLERIVKKFQSNH